MSKRKCSNCGFSYWVNVYVDEEYVCPQCGFVENEKLVGQKQGRIGVMDE
ncbi:MAG TPA: hypothetical protein VIH27_04160 [Nitrososphaerales archaeon]